MAAQEFIIDPVMTLDWMSNVILLSSCVQLIMYLQSVSVQLVKHDLVWPQAGSSGIPAAVRLVWNTKNETSNNDIFKWRFAMIYIKLYITDQNHGLVQFYFFLEHHIIENKASFKTVIWCLWEFVISGFYSSISSWIVCMVVVFESRSSPCSTISSSYLDELCSSNFQSWCHIWIGSKKTKILAIKSSTCL